MAKFIECTQVTSDGGFSFIAIQVDTLAAVHPAFDGPDFTHSVVYLAGGHSFDVEETWEQISDAIEREGFSVPCRPFSEIGS